MVSPRMITVTTIALATAVIAAPAASARPARMAPRQGVAAISVSQSQQLAAGNAYASHRNVSAIRPAADLSAPAAYTRQDKQVAPSSSSPAAVSTAPPAAHAAFASGGFDWGDAGIGAAGGLAISIVGIGGALVLSQRRTRRTRTSAVATG